MDITVNKDSLYCAMLKLACYDDDARKERLVDRGKPCELCKLPTDACVGHYEQIMDLAERVGIKISPCINRAADYSVHLDESRFKQQLLNCFRQELETESHYEYQF